MMRCTCGSEMIRYQNHLGTRYTCILCGAHYDERTDKIVGCRLPRGVKARAR